jgi:hypothetical protein
MSQICKSSSIFQGYISFASLVIYAHRAKNVRLAPFPLNANPLGHQEAKELCD